MELKTIFEKAVQARVSDIHFIVNSPIMFREHGHLRPYNDIELTAEHCEDYVKEILTNDQLVTFETVGEIDLAYSVTGIGRFRINIFKQRDSYSMAVRTVTMTPPTIEQLGLPEVISRVAKKQRGLILVTGPTGSGKSTTLAAMISQINQTRNEHIITIEDPIEYLHTHGNCIVNQREIGSDSRSFADALRASLRQDPDIILVGEMRDLETISTAVTAAETGHLVMSTLHTLGATKTLERIIDAFPPHQQAQVRTQLSSVLEAVISQQLVPRADGKGKALAMEILLCNNAVRNLIREGKSHQIQTFIQTGKNVGMVAMDESLVTLYQKRLIDKEALMKYAIDEMAVRRQMDRYSM